MLTVLILFNTSAFSEALYIAWSEAKIERVTFRRVDSDELTALLVSSFWREWG